MLQYMYNTSVKMRTEGLMWNYINWLKDCYEHNLLMPVVCPLHLPHHYPSLLCW